MKKARLLLAVLSLSAALSFPVLAGSWQQDSIGLKYQEEDGSYLINCWKWIDGNADGIAESYYFDANGYMLTNSTTPDGYTVDATGAWILNNIVQTQAVSSQIVPAVKSSADETATTHNTTSKQAVSGIAASPYEGYTIVVNTNTKKYHVPACKSVSDMLESNKGYCSDAAYLSSQGYAACKRCH